MIPLNRSCPGCRKASVVIDKNHIRCTSDGCKIDHVFACPLCDASLETSPYIDDGEDGRYTCQNCQRDIPIRKVKHLIETGMVVDHQHKCDICHGPTIHQKHMNMGHRCFNFPQCSGQGDLFNQTHETLVFLDFETTGLEIGKDSIIEIGALKIDENGEEIPFQCFVKPREEISAEISGFTGITNDMVIEAPNLHDSTQKLADFIGDSIIVAHNAQFDVPWLLSATLRHNAPLQDNTVVCTLRWAKECGEPSKSLGKLTKKYNITHQNAHRALADAAATKELYFIFKNNKDIPRPDQALSDFTNLTEKLVTRYKDFIQA